MVMKTEWNNLGLEASSDTPILGNALLERLNDLSTITRLSSSKTCVRARAS